MINADEDRIRQVITNLISNALKYAPGGNITVRGSVSGRFGVISVIDEGPGIAPEDIIHIFDRFYRAKRTFNTVKGNGLGLFLCKAIIEAHGGKIRVENRDDRRGAVFTFTLPLDSPDSGRNQVIDFSSAS